MISENGIIMYCDFYVGKMKWHEGFILRNLHITIPGNDKLTGVWKYVGFSLWRKL